MTDKLFSTISFPVSVTEQRASDLLSNAFDGGSTYWIKNLKRLDVERGTYPSEVPFKGGSLELTCENPSAEGNITVTINSNTLRKGLRVMAEKYPKHFADFLNEQDDATTGDVFLQSVVFGEVIFG